MSTADLSGSVQAWTPNQNRFRVLALEGNPGASHQLITFELRLSPDEKTVYADHAMTNRSDYALAWTLPDGKNRWSTSRISNGASSRFIISPDGKRLAFRNPDQSRVIIFDLTRPLLPKKSVPHEPLARTFPVVATLATDPQQFVWSPDSQTLISLTQPISFAPGKRFEKGILEF